MLPLAFLATLRNCKTANLSKTSFGQANYSWSALASHTIAKPESLLEHIQLLVEARTTIFRPEPLADRLAKRASIHWSETDSSSTGQSAFQNSFAHQLHSCTSLFQEFHYLPSQSFISFSTAQLQLHHHFHHHLLHPLRFLAFSPQPTTLYLCPSAV